ncbi:DUF2264 domain-containing protein [Chitinophaga caseinilytica]|uniref:DUF2264 domain-containing protein n=1 Tax=Chitinophaga caseinilytica TaxID=2267521 RepID=A0ABZ2Z8D0_9BACT
MERRNFLKWTSLFGAAAAVPGAAAMGISPEILPAPAGDRAFWVELLRKMAMPVLGNLSAGTLRKNWEMEYAPQWGNREKTSAWLEAFGRLTAGIAPWLALPDDASAEGKLRSTLRAQMLQSLDHCVDPSSPDYMNWSVGGQPLVDAAFLVHGFLRAPKALWEPLSAITKARFVKELQQFRRLGGFKNNWTLFAGIVEAFLCHIGEEYRKDRIDEALDKTASWYKGDSQYGDGPSFHFDYYNAFVIQPMYVDILKVMAGKDAAYRKAYDLALRRMQRYAVILERQISPEGTYPIVGRSATYRAAVFQPLAQLALTGELPEELTPAQVRCGMTAVMKRQFNHPGTFDRKGWLTLGVIGHQPGVADYYSNSGSMYLAAVALLPLGLPASHPFWAAPFADWTMRKAWKGEAFGIDHAINF